MKIDFLICLSKRNSHRYGWERATRELAGRAIAVVGRRDPAWVRSVALPALLRRALSPALEQRHGASVGAAEALLALHAAGAPCVADHDEVAGGAAGGEASGGLASLVVGLVAAVEKARLYRGKGGEVMRAAVCRYVAGRRARCVQLWPIA